MSLKVQLEVCRREYEANAEPDVVDAAHRSIKALAETNLIAKAVKAGETAPLFGLRCGRGDPINRDHLNRGPVAAAAKRRESPFPVLQDPGCKVAARYRIAFTLPEQFRAAYLALGHPNPAKTGSNCWALPIPASYVLDSSGLIVLSYLDADHTTRLDPTEIIVALTHLRARAIPSENNR